MIASKNRFLSIELAIFHSKVELTLFRIFKQFYKRKHNTQNILFEIDQNSISHLTTSWKDLEERRIIEFECLVKLSYEMTGIAF